MILKSDIELCLKEGKLIPFALKKIGLSQEQAYIIYYNIECTKCICEEERPFKSFARGYNQYCSRECANSYKWTPESKESGNSKRKEYWSNNQDKFKIKNKNISHTNKIVWGTNTSLRKEQVRKMKETFNTGEPQRKGKATKKLLYSDENYNNQMKNENTTLLRYGVTCILMLDSNRQKMVKALKEKSKIFWMTSNRSDWFRYSTLARKYTEHNDLSVLLDINLRSFDYHLDHRYSIKEGFINNIPIHIISSITNLVILEAKQNQKKGTRCSITKEQLLKEYYND